MMRVTIHTESLDVRFRRQRDPAAIRSLGAEPIEDDVRPAIVA